MNFVVCICAPFNQEAVKEYLATIPNKETTAKELYNACSGGKKPNCELCILHKLGEMVDEHNRKIDPQPV